MLLNPDQYSPVTAKAQTAEISSKCFLECLFVEHVMILLWSLWQVMLSEIKDLGKSTAVHREVIGAEHLLCHPVTPYTISVE